MSFSIQTRWVNGVPHLQLRESDTGVLRMQWQLVRTWDTVGADRILNAAAPETTLTLAALTRQLFLVACTEDLGRSRPFALYAAVEKRLVGATTETGAGRPRWCAR
jgi:hypothetical protein